MTKKSNSTLDVPADNPTGTMDRFTTGLKRVLAASKPRPLKRKPTKRP